MSNELMPEITLTFSVEDNALKYLLIFQNNVGKREMIEGYMGINTSVEEAVKKASYVCYPLIMAIKDTLEKFEEDTT